ncbi:hypothetical protein [Aliivibrio fischeri]|uniref:hypothetical protein n=1 Tax=Aliivibrio fischeri TaxID=668 RepID=UPI0015B6E17F|nr:hypothetical protein [Aliivibrio fischeri]
MKIENYNKIISYLDILEAEMNKIAAEVGHMSLAEFTFQKKAKEDNLKKAA